MREKKAITRKVTKKDKEDKEKRKILVAAFGNSLKRLLKPKQKKAY